MSTKWPPSARGKAPSRGMTLIELLVGVAVSAVVVIALLGLYMAGQRYFFNQGAKADAIEEIRAPMARVARDIRESALVSQATVSVGSDAYSTNPNCLVLDVPALDAGGMIIPGLDDTVIYTVNQGQLHRIIVANGPGRTSADDVLASGVIGFSLAFFKEDGITAVSGYNETFIVTVSIASSRPSMQRGGQPFVETLNTRVKLRNKTLA